MLFQSERRFKFWDYNVSHNQLLLRSPRNSETVDNVDMVFWGVDFLNIPTVLNGMEFYNASAQELMMIENTIQKKYEHESAYCIVSENKRFYIVALGFKIIRNRLDIFESTLFYFGKDSPHKDVGEVLVRS